MGKIKDILMGSASHGDALLINAATTALDRNGKSPIKALAGFIDRLRASPEIRALIGADTIRSKALAYKIFAAGGSAMHKLCNRQNRYPRK